MRLTRNVRKTVTAGVAVAMVSASVLVTTALPAMAHTDRKAVRDACGKGYEIVKRRPIGNRGVDDNPPEKWGRLIVARLRNAPGHVCAVTKSNGHWIEHGKPEFMSVFICRARGRNECANKGRENRNYNAKHWVKIKFVAGKGRGLQFKETSSMNIMVLTCITACADAHDRKQLEVGNRARS